MQSERERKVFLLKLFFFLGKKTQFGSSSLDINAAIILFDMEEAETGFTLLHTNTVLLQKVDFIGLLAFIPFRICGNGNVCVQYMHTAVKVTKTFIA